MKRTWVFSNIAAVALSAMVLAPHAAQAASKSKVVSFKGTYNGTATVLIDSSSVKIVSVKGTGSASLIGAGSVSGSGDGTGASGQCVPFTGNGVIKGVSGTIKFFVTSNKSQGCSNGQSGPVTVAVDGVAKVTGGSGKAAGARGNLKFKGTLKLNDTTGSQSGAFTGRVSGNLTIGH